MITQTALYKALLQYLENNKVSAEEIESASRVINDSIETFSKKAAGYIDSFKESANELSQKIEETVSISDKLESSKSVFEKVSGFVKKMAENIDPLIATGIYERVNILKDSIDAFEAQIMSKLDSGKTMADHSHGLLNKDRIKVFLVGEFSAGKTTFARRLLGGSSGHIAGNPTTGCLVIHKQKSTPSLLVAFNKEFSISDSEKFERFLNSYNLRKFFSNVNNVFTPNANVKLFDNNDFSSDKILEFLKDANDFPEAFTSIVWNHKKPSQAKYDSFLDFADLYDMPGIGGEERHDEVIKKIFNEHKPDVVLYLIDTAAGCPSEDELKALPGFLQSITRCEPAPLFYWVYQKPTEYASLNIANLDEQGPVYDENFLKDNKKKMEDWVDNIKINHSGLFNEKLINYLAETAVLDARGLKDDTETAQNAASIVLQHYFCRNAMKYCENAGTLLLSESNAAQLEVMNYRQDTPGHFNSTENSFIQNKIIDAIKISSSLSVEGARIIFQKALCIDVSYDIHNFPFDLRNVLLEMKNDIDNIIDQMVKALRMPAKGIGVIFNAKSDIISVDAINNNFWANYEKNAAWQGLLYKTQSYHWLISHYKGLVAPQYVNKIGFALLNNIKKGIKHLEESKMPFSLTVKLFEKNSELLQKV